MQSCWSNRAKVWIFGSLKTSLLALFPGRSAKKGGNGKKTKYFYRHYWRKWRRDKWEPIMHASHFLISFSIRFFCWVQEAYSKVNYWSWMIKIVWKRLQVRPISCMSSLALGPHLSACPIFYYLLLNMMKLGCRVLREGQGGEDDNEERSGYGWQQLEWYEWD